MDGPIWMAFLRKRSDPGLHLAQVTGHWSVSFWLVFAPSFQRGVSDFLVGPVPQVSSAVDRGLLLGRLWPVVIEASAALSTWMRFDLGISPISTPELHV